MDINQALQRKTEQRMEVLRRADFQTIYLHGKIAGLAELDQELSILPMKAYALGGTNREERIKNLEIRSTELQKQRKEMLAAHGYAADYDSPRFECAACSDTGYRDFVLCDCVKRLINENLYAASGLGSALLGKGFADFSLKYYSGDERQTMQFVLNQCKDYAENFSIRSQSVLMLGGTGLGKTHLSAAIANAVLPRGYSVVYDSAQSIFSAYEAARFGRTSNADIGNYEDCDLLIIDDLGAECATQYTVAVFFDLLNNRLVRGKPMIISTNLSPLQIKKNYGERVYSRMLGEFILMRFQGQDVRMQKIKGV